MCPTCQVGKGTVRSARIHQGHATLVFKVVQNACMDEQAALLTSGFALPQSRRSRWQWMHRFRKTWGVEMGRFQNLERISPAEMLEKARRVFGVSAVRGTGVLAAGPKCFPPRLGAENGVRIVTPKMVPRGFFPGKNTRAGIKKRHLFFSSGPRGGVF